MSNMTLNFLLGAAALAGGFSWSSSGLAQEVNIRGGRIFMDGRLVQEQVNLTQTRFNYLFVYVPEAGLWIISNREFEGAQPAGAFDHELLQASLHGHDFRLEAEGDILGAEPETAAWAKLDLNFRLQVSAPMIGYGANPNDPYRWEHHVHSNR